MIHHQTDYSSRDTDRETYLAWLSRAEQSCRERGPQVFYVGADTDFASRRAPSRKQLLSDL